MKRIVIFAFIAAFLTTGCHKKSEQELLSNRLRSCTEQYVKEELQIGNPDSVVINKIDTVTEMGYAKLVLELLENLEYQYKLMYDEATLANDDRKIDNLEIYLRQISSQTDYFRAIEEAESADNQKILLYMISAAYYKEGEVNDFICFAKPDFSLHILDPFADNLLQ